MRKNAVVTVRISEALKRRIAARAKRERRSVSAQIEHELEQALVQERVDRRRTSALGMFEGASVPTEADFREVRALLWGRLGRRSA